MTARMIALSLGLVLVLGSSELRASHAQDKLTEKVRESASSDVPEPKAVDGDTSKADTSKADTSNGDTTKRVKTLEKATFGGGCFWCMEAVYERIPGVKDVVSGYAGGNIAYPSYEMVHSGLTGHAEVVQITFDPSEVSYEKLLKLFWSAHDPTTVNAQGDDFGTQYRSVIFYHNDAQRKAALASYQDLTSRRVFRAPIVTQLMPINNFYPAEPEHQNYYRNNRSSNYSAEYIDPKLRKLHLNSAAPAAKKRAR